MSNAWQSGVSYSFKNEEIYQTNVNLKVKNYKKNLFVYVMQNKVIVIKKFKDFKAVNKTL